MTQTDAEPITNQEIRAAGDRIATDLIDHLLAEARDYLGTDAIDETIRDDKDGSRLDLQARGIVYGIAWDRLGNAAAIVRDRVLTEEAAKLKARCPHHGDADPCLIDCQCPAADVLLAARAVQEPETEAGR